MFLCKHNKSLLIFAENNKPDTEFELFAYLVNIQASRWNKNRNTNTRLSFSPARLTTQLDFQHARLQCFNYTFPVDVSSTTGTRAPWFPNRPIQALETQHCKSSTHPLSTWRQTTANSRHELVSAVDLTELSFLFVVPQKFPLVTKRSH